jgi:hypothetical protein
MPVAGMAVVAAILLAATAGPAFEAPTSTVTASSTIRAAVAATVWASASASVSAATAERPLETGTGIAANTRGLAREFRKRLLRLTRSARARLTWKQNNIVVN